MMKGSELLACQQERIGNSLAVPLFERFEVGLRGPVFDGQHHSSEVFNGKGSCHSLLLLEMMDRSLICIKEIV